MSVEIARLRLRETQPTATAPLLEIHVRLGDGPTTTLDRREVEDLRDACERFLNGERI
jgi:hypothetical protein